MVRGSACRSIGRWFDSGTGHNGDNPKRLNPMVKTATNIDQSRQLLPLYV